VSCGGRAGGREVCWSGHVSSRLVLSCVVKETPKKKKKNHVSLQTDSTHSLSRATHKAVARNPNKLYPYSTLIDTYVSTYPFHALRRMQRRQVINVIR